MKLFNKVNVSSILIAHVDTLKNDNTKRPGWDDLFTFLIIPIVGTWLLLDNNIFLTEAITNIIITALSILIGLLINVIVLIFDMVKRYRVRKIKTEILHQLLANISYTILISIICILFTILTYSPIRFFHVFATAVVYFLAGNFLFTILMILKRMYILFKSELDESSEP